MSARVQLTSRQLAPPSSERQKEPWSAVWISAYTRRESLGATATSILPNGDLGRPGCCTFVQVVPPSRDTYSPLPGPPLYIAQVCISTCHIPANSTDGCFASIVSPEQPVFWSTNNTRCQVLPASVVR